MTAASTTWRRLWRRVAVAVALGLAAPLSWAPLTPAEHVRASAFLASLVLLALLAVRRMPTAEDRYAAALHDAVALEVQLGHVRVATVHAREGRTQAVVTWREAQTALLDADGRALASVGRNALSQGWTMSLRIDDPEVLLLLGPDGGRMTLLAAVDRKHDPWARVGNSPLRVERCDVALGV